MRTSPLLPALLLVSCQETLTSKPSPPGPLEGTVVARFRVESGGRTLGYLVETSFPAPGPPRYFRVEDARFQDLGFVTEQGVAYRYEPHRADPVHVTTDTMKGNLRALFGVEGDLALVRLEAPPPRAR